jgi:hypothetical protein
MPQIITALFEDYGQAQRALEALIEAGMARDRIAIIGERPGSEVSSISGFRELSARDDALAELHDLPLPDEDMQLFEKALRRGCVLIAARVERQNMEEAIRILEMFDPIDLDRRSETWAQDASSGADAGAPLGAAPLIGLPDAANLGAMTDSNLDIDASEPRAQPDLYRRDTDRAGPVRTYSRD